MTTTALANISEARLPERYQAARQALSKCSTLDECKDWADKAEALASYARQAEDDSLEKYATRIRSRAIRRAGDLMEEFDARGAHRKSVGDGTSSQRKVAAAAGMSKRQEVTARRVASIPEETFEELVESEDPPAVTKLAEIGKKALASPKPKGFKEATKALGKLRAFAKFCESNNAGFVAGGVLEGEVTTAREWVETIDAWLDQFVTKL